MPLVVRAAVPADAPELARVAAVTFPLACPPHTTPEAKADFIATHLSEARFDDYLADPGRDLFVAELDGVVVGYTMLVAGEPSDADVAAAITTRPTIELSKVYVLPEAHGGGASEAASPAADDGDPSVEVEPHVPPRCLDA